MESAADSVTLLMFAYIPDDEKEPCQCRTFVLFAYITCVLDNAYQRKRSTLV